MKALLQHLCVLGATVALASAQTPFNFKELWSKPGIMSAAFSPDGKMVAAGSSSSSGKTMVVLLNSQDGSLLDEWPAGAIGVWEVQFAPQGNLLAATSGGRVVSIFDLSSRDLLYSITTMDQGAPIAFSPTAPILAVGDNRAISLYNAASGALIRAWEVGTDAQGLGALNVIVFLPDGKSLATGSGVRGINVALKLWDVESGKELWSQPTAQTYGINSIAVSPDGQSLATGSAHLHFPGPMQLWNAGTGALIHTFPAPMFSAAFSPQAPALLTLDTNLTLWSLPPRSLLQQKGIASTVFRSMVRFNPAGDRFLTAGMTLRVFETPLILLHPGISHSQLTLQWMGPTNSFTLESSDLSSPWTTHSEASSTPITIPVQPGAKYFRLKR